MTEPEATTSMLTGIAARRLHAQHVASGRLRGPRDVVAALGAVQSQDYAQSLWAVGLRTSGTTLHDVEAALATGSLVRTWAMRGTLHLVLGQDVRWMLDLLARRVMARLTPKVWAHHAMDRERMTLAERAITRALAGNAVTRKELITILGRGGIPDDHQQSYFIFGYLSQHGIICPGPKRNGQQTFVLLDEWAPDQLAIGGEEALARLAGRYFASHSPATIHDLANWSGLGLDEARRALAAVVDEFETTSIDGAMYVLPPAGGGGAAGGHLLPAYDEFLIGYADRRASFAKHRPTPISTYNGMFYATIVDDGQVVGLWRRTVKPTQIDVTLHPTASAFDERVINRSVDELVRFYARPCRVRVGDALPVATQAPWSRRGRDAQTRT